jgi:hypothetical protein
LKILPGRINSYASKLSAVDAPFAPMLAGVLVVSMNTAQSRRVKMLRKQPDTATSPSPAARLSWQ